MNKNTNYLSVVQGNDFTLNINVSKRNADNAAYSPYDMTACSQVCCFLVAVTGGRRYKLPVTVDGNVLTAEIDGALLNIGLFGLELLFEDAESKSKRSYEPALIKIVRTNAEATFTNADFDSEDDCRLHMTIGVNSAFITIGSPTADAQIDATSYNAVSNAAVADAINNLQTQIDSIGSEILDPASVYTKDETEALVDAMIDPQEMADYVSYVASYYTTTEEFENANEAISGSLNDLNTRISAIEDNPVDLSAYVSKEELNAAAYLQASALDGMASESYVTEQIAAIPQADMSAYVSKEELNAAAYLQASALDGMASESYVTEKIAAIPQADMSAYVSKEELNAAAYLQSDDLSDFATKSYVSQQIEAIPATDLSQYATQEFVSQQIAAIPQPDLSAYVTETELTNTLSSYAQLADLISNERVVSTALNSLADRIETVEGDYVSDTELDEALLPYATEAYVAEKIDSIAPADLNEYVSKNYLAQQAYLQADDLTDYATKSYVTTYVTEQVAADLSGYVSKDELSAASYLQSDDLNGYATESYVTEKIDSISPADLTEYVSKNYLSSQSYLQADDLTDYATKSYVTTYVTEQVASDLSGYVSKDELSAAGYLQSDDLADYATKSYVTTYVTEQVASDLSGYVSKDELSAAGYLQSDDLADYATKSYVTTYVTEQVASDLSGYVSKDELSAAGYITANDVASMGYLTDSDLADYVTDSDLANAGYVTNTALNTTLASYTTKADVPYKFVVMSYAQYTALATKDPNTFYCIPE